MVIIYLNDTPWLMVIIRLNDINCVTSQIFALCDKVLKHKQDFQGTKRGCPLSPQQLPLTL